jgi:hypothetical protein
MLCDRTDRTLILASNGCSLRQLLCVAVCNQKRSCSHSMQYSTQSKPTLQPSITFSCLWCRWRQQLGLGSKIFHQRHPNITGTDFSFAGLSWVLSMITRFLKPPPGRFWCSDYLTSSSALPRHLHRTCGSGLASSEMIRLHFCADFHISLRFHFGFNA